MTHTEIEIKLNRDRAWLLETYAGMSPEEVERPITESRHDAAVKWSAKDHLVHLSGIERSFNDMIRRYLAGDSDPIKFLKDAEGKALTREEIMPYVHRMNEAWVVEHRGKPLDEVVALGQQVRSETLALLASIPASRLTERVPGAPWGDGTIGTILGINGDHGRLHYKSVKEHLNPEPGIQG